MRNPVASTAKLKTTQAVVSVSEGPIQDYYYLLSDSDI